MPTLEQFTWATFLYWAAGGDDDYQCLMLRGEFLRLLRTDPLNVPSDQLRDYLLAKFLNRWRSRINNNEQSAAVIERTLDQLSQYLVALLGLAIDTVDLD